MKKKLASLFVAAAMILALPNAAFAATFNSPSGTTVTDPSSGVTLSVSADNLTASDGGYIGVEPTDEVASNVPTGVTPLANFEVTAVGSVTFDTLTLTFSVGAGYAGATATVYIQNDGGTTEARVATVASNGTVTISVYDPGIICSIVVDGSTTSGASVTVDTSSTSPATDANLLPVLCMTVAATVGAGVSAISLRKRLSK